MIDLSDPRFEATEYVVEATSCERHDIWYRWSHVRGVEFVQDALMASGRIASDDRRAMNVNVAWSMVAGARVAFVDFTVGWTWDRRIAQEWLGTAFRCLLGPDGWRSRHADAMNFTGVMNHIALTRRVPMRDIVDIEDALRKVESSTRWRRSG